MYVFVMESECPIKHFDFKISMRPLYRSYQPVLFFRSHV